MPEDFLTEAVAAAFDGPAETPVEAPAPETPEGDAPPADATAAAPTDSVPALTDSVPALTSPTAATPAPPDAVSVEDLKAVRDRFAADHPELIPVMDAFLKESGRGLNRKFEQLSAMKREAAEAVVRDARLQGIPEADLVQMAQWHQLAQTNPQAAADFLAQQVENLRQVAANPNPNPYGALSPQIQQELANVRQYMQQQTASQIVQQIDGAFVGLQPEFGGAVIPEGQRVHTLETIVQNNLGPEAIPLVWRGLYGADFAKQQGIKQGQALRQQKAGLSAGTTTAPQPPATPPEGTDLWSEIDAICTSAGRK